MNRPGKRVRCVRHGPEAAPAGGTLFLFPRSSVAIARHTRAIRPGRLRVSSQSNETRRDEAARKTQKLLLLLLLVKS